MEKLSYIYLEFLEGKNTDLCKLIAKLSVQIYWTTQLYNVY